MIIKNFSFKKDIKVYFDVMRNTKVILYDFCEKETLLLKIECKLTYSFSFALDDYGINKFDEELFEKDFLNTFSNEKRNKESSKTFSNIIKTYYPIKKFIPMIGL